MQTNAFEDFAVVCCGRLHMDLLTDPDEFAMTRRLARVGAVTVTDVAAGSEFAVDANDVCGSYRIVMARAGRIEGSYRGLSFAVLPGMTAVFPPEGNARRDGAPTADSSPSKSHALPSTTHSATHWAGR